MGERKQSSPAVSRDYKPTVDATVRALELLLRWNQGTKRPKPDSSNDHRSLQAEEGGCRDLAIYLPTNSS